MPRTTQLTPPMLALLEQYDGVARIDQLVSAGMSRRGVNARVERGRWLRLLPGVVLTSAGVASPRQLMIAAWLWAGPASAIDGPTACAWYGLRGLTRPDRIHVVAPWASHARSHAFVVVRRTIGEIIVGDRGVVPYVAAPAAVLVAARGAPSERAAIDVLSRALQRDITTTAELLRERERIGDKWCADLDRALKAVGVGVRSPAEKEAADLLLASRLLPTPRFNQWLDLGDGGSLVCPDALIEDAGLAIDVEGKKWHAWGNAFDDMHRRHERMTAAGLIVLHPTPTRIRREGRQLLAGIERTYGRYAGRGMPPGVRLVPPPAIAA